MKDPACVSLVLMTRRQRVPSVGSSKCAITESQCSHWVSLEENRLLPVGRQLLKVVSTSIFQVFMLPVVIYSGEVVEQTGNAATSYSSWQLDLS